MPQSDESLSIVLPVYNAQHLLPRMIAAMLEILPEVTPHFEVLIVDDGSTDQTEEVARELVRYYPQLRFVRHARRLGGQAVVHSGYEHTSGKVVIIQQENTPVRETDLRRLRQLRADRGLVVAQEDRPGDEVERADVQQADRTGSSAIRASGERDPERSLDVALMLEILRRDEERAAEARRRHEEAGRDRRVDAPRFAARPRRRRSDAAV